MRFIATAVLLFLLAVAGSAQRASQQPSSAPPPPKAHTSATGFDTIVRPFLARHCYDCHGNKGEPEQGLNLQAFESVAALADHRDRWEEVLRKLRAAEMPPLEEEQPDEDERQAVAGWLAAELDRLDRTTPPQAGRVTARRLNRTEYNNTVHELLGVNLRPADDFPQDDSGYGFDNIGDVLSLSPALMEKYLASADRVARQAIFGPPRMEPTLVKLRSEGRRVRESRSIPAAYDETGLSLPNAFHAVHRIPIDGEYVVKVVLGGVRPKGSEPVAVSLWVDQQEVASNAHDPERAATFADDRQEFGGQTTEFRVRLAAGDRWLSVAIPRMFEGLPARFGGPKPASRPEPPPPEFKPPPGVSEERLAVLRKRFEETRAELEKLPLNAVRVGSVELAGPYSYASGPSRASLRKVYTCRHTTGRHATWCAPRIVRDLARRAFRRPVSAREAAPFVALTRRAAREEGSFEEGLAVGIQALLVSPDFLFRIERGPAGSGTRRLTQHELATRLSYFLWASMPDAALLAAADAGTLRDPAVLTAQVRRMLRDPKSIALAEHFGGQWLQFRALESITRDRERFPDFEDYLRLSMRRETELFFDHIVRRDRSILDFIDGRYSFLNERLARHYGIDGVSGPAFRRVELAGSPRGGVVTQGSVLAVSSYATRTSPVLRGKWILENLLNAPPPEPPPDVPNLDEVTIGTTAALRDQLEAHRRNPTCASCHRRMDPLGFGLENFDAVGAWRTMDGKFPVDASGTLPDGRSFTGPEELRGLLMSDRDAFARALTSKLLTYALGRGLERYDAPTVRAIAARLPKYEYRFSGLVLEIVTSLPFQNVASEGSAGSKGSKGSRGSE